MPSFTPNPSRKGTRVSTRHNKSATVSSTVFSSASPPPTSEGHDTLTFITTGLPPSTPSPPHSPSTPLPPTPLSSTPSPFPHPPAEAKDDFNDAMYLSTDDSDAESPHTPQPPSIARLIHDYSTPTPPPPHPRTLPPSTPLLTPASTLRRRARKVATLASSPTCLLLLTSAALLVLSAVNSLLWVSISSSYGLSHAFFLDQISGALFIVFLIPLVLVRTRGEVSVRGYVTPSFLLIGFLDALYGLFITLGSSYTPGSFQLLLFQFSLLFSFFFSALLSPGSVRRRQVVGCALIFASSLVAIVPSSEAAETGTHHPMRWESVLVYVMGVFLFSVNCVLKENLLKADELDVFTFSLIDQTLAFVFTFAAVPLLFIPHVSRDSVATFGPHLWGGLTCFLWGESAYAGAGACRGVWLPTLLFSASNVLMQLLMLVVLRLSSTFVLNLLSTVQLPISSLLFSSSFLLKNAASPLYPSTLVGLLGVTAGSLIYGGVGRGADRSSVEEEWGIERRLLTQATTVGVARVVGAPGEVVLGGGGGLWSRRGSEDVRGSGGSEDFAPIMTDDVDVTFDRAHDAKWQRQQQPAYT